MGDLNSQQILFEITPPPTGTQFLLCGFRFVSWSAPAPALTSCVEMYSGCGLHWANGWTLIVGWEMGILWDHVTCGWCGEPPGGSGSGQRV